MLFDALTRLGSKADRVLFFPDYWDLKIESETDRVSQLLLVARDKYKAKLHPIKPMMVLGKRNRAGKGTDANKTRVGETWAALPMQQEICKDRG